MESFERWFARATGHQPFPYQRRLAELDVLPTVVDVPTGLGKTAAVTLAWLWRRRYASEAVRVQTPRRLIYCLPSRVLVTQTAAAISGWLAALGLAETSVPSHAGQADSAPSAVRVHVLMGGDVDEAWLERPEADAVLVGTQDMLLSRALNRGYGMSRYQWSMAFAGVHADAQWVFDELQLMGAGLPCGAQLAGFRRLLGGVGPSGSLWMSATATVDQLATVDHPRPEGGWSRLRLDAADRAHPAVQQRTSAAKHLSPSPVNLCSDGAGVDGEQAQAVCSPPSAEQVKTYPADLAAAVLREHRPGTLSLVVLNRVDRAQAVFAALLKQGCTRVHTALIHSRFRPHDRAQHERLLAADGSHGGDRIIVATQTVEAGVDISCQTLWTELAPWSSLVQRMGRCHRYGELSEAGRVFWIDVALDRKLAAPYGVADLAAARAALAELPPVEEREDSALSARDCGLNALAGVRVAPPFHVYPVPRRRDLLELFDTDPDLSGDDLDVSRFIRDSDDTDVQLYWRQIGDDPGERPLPPSRDELCSVPIGALSNALKLKGKLILWAWDHLDRRWQKSRRAVPGRTYLVDVAAGHYSADLGWQGSKAKKPVEALAGTGVDAAVGDGASQEADPRSQFNRGPWVPLADHLQHVAAELQALLPAVPLPSLPGAPDQRAAAAALRRALVTAAGWHDVGKAHEAFQYMLAGPGGEDAPEPQQVWAKSGPAARDVSAAEDPDESAAKPKRRRPSVLKVGEPSDGQRVVRRGFRHELASALAWLQGGAQGPHHDLIAYLIAAHHGKVRMRITPLPNERGRKAAPGSTPAAFARGVWHGDPLPAVAVPTGAQQSPACSLELSVMSLGDGAQGWSWSARTAELLRTWGPFRLAWLETVVRLADWRASAAEREGNGAQVTVTLSPEDQPRSGQEGRT